jgi:hypothetical protein
MKLKINTHKILFWYTLIFIILNLILGFSFGAWKNNSIALFAFTLILTYFVLKRISKGKFIGIILTILNLFCYALITIIWLMNLLTAKSSTQIILGIVYTPLVFYFGQELINKIKILVTKISVQREIEINKKAITNNTEISNPVKISDKDRRQFLKMVGSTGLGLITLSLLNPKKAGATFFGSVPGPGTISIKDADGNKIDPAAKQPTDGYKISKIDDTSSDTYAYYGFVDQNGQWYIQRETTSGVDTGDFLYKKGASNFSSAWGTRADPTYDYFDSIF